MFMIFKSIYATWKTIQTWWAKSLSLVLKALENVVSWACCLKSVFLIIIFINVDLFYLQYANSTGHCDSYLKCNLLKTSINSRLTKDALPL